MFPESYIYDAILAAGLFDADFYNLQYPDVVNAGLDPLQHYITHGAKEGRDPSAAFSTNAYRAAHPHLMNSVNPLWHFIQTKGGDFPAAPSLVDPLDLSPEIYEKLRSSEMFDADWYLQVNPDVRASWADPLLHFLKHGAAEGRVPSQNFPLIEYQIRYRTELANGINPLVDFVLNAEKRDLSFQFEDQVALRRQYFKSIALDVWLDTEERFRAACNLVTNMQDNYDELIDLFGTLARESALASSAGRMQILCKQLARRAKQMPMEPYRDGNANHVHGPYQDPLLVQESVMILRRAGAKRVILVFTGNDHQVWVPVQVFQSYLPDDSHIVFLRDPLRLGHLFGLQSLGFGYQNTVAGLKRMINSLKVEEVFCIGSSSGGSAAMRYGDDINAKSCLSLVPSTQRDAILRAEVERDYGKYQIDAQPPEPIDMRDFFLQRPSHPPTTIVYGAANEKDSKQALHLQGIPNVTLVDVPDYPGHDVMAELIASGRLERLIDAMLQPMATGAIRF